MTMLEVSKLGRYGFMGGHSGSLAMQMSHHHNHNHTLQADMDNALSGIRRSNTTAGHAHAHGQPHQQHGSGCCMGFLMHLLGFDRFTLGKAANRLACAGHAVNPFSVGIVSNSFFPSFMSLRVDSVHEQSLVPTRSLRCTPTNMVFHLVFHPNWSIFLPTTTSADDGQSFAYLYVMPSAKLDL